MAWAPTRPSAAQRLPHRAHGREPAQAALDYPADHAGLTVGAIASTITIDPGTAAQVAGFKSERRPASSRNRWPASDWNARPVSIRNLMAIAIFANAAKGTSALQLCRDLDVSYKTAFVLAHKLREAMATDQAKYQPKGEIEVDGAYFGGSIRQENYKADRKDRRLAEHQTGKRRVVVVMRERQGRSLPFVVKAEDEGVTTIARCIQPKGWRRRRSGTARPRGMSSAAGSVGPRRTLRPRAASASGSPEPARGPCRMAPRAAGLSLRRRCGRRWRPGPRPGGSRRCRSGGRRG